MRWIGLTGGIATGKSKVAAFLVQLGHPVISADELAHQTLLAGSPAALAVSREFGDDVLAADGSVDRKRLGEKIAAAGRVNGAAMRARLELIVHPDVRRLAVAARQRLTAAGVPLAFYEVPLLFEKSLEKEFDAIVCVATEPELQIQRLMQRSGFTREQALERIAWLLPQADKLRGSDIVIWNNGSEAELLEQVKAALVKLSLP